MSSSSAAIQLGLVLVCLLAVLILLPAVLFGVVQQWQVIFLLLSYFGFYIATVWRVLKYGKLSKTTEDEQYKQTKGVWILAVQFVGIFGVHWLALYDFSRAKNVENVLLTTVGILVIGSAIVINQAAIRTLKGFFDRITIKPDHRLITTGIYSKVRHPIYLSYILLFTGFCTTLHSFLSLVLLAVVCTVWLGNRIAIEEKMLVERFGEEYKAYQRRTKRLFPFIY